MENSNPGFFEEELDQLVSSQPMRFEPLQQSLDLNGTIPFRIPEIARDPTSKQYKVESLLAANLVTMVNLFKTLASQYSAMNRQLEKVKDENEKRAILLESQYDCIKEHVKVLGLGVDELVGKRRGRLEQDSARRKRKKDEKEKEVDTHKQAFKRSRP